MKLHFIALLFTVFVVVGCVPQKGQSMETPEGWSQYCLGYNTFALPGHMTVAQTTAEVEFASFRAARNVAARPRDYLRALPEVAEVVFEKEVNGWTYITARKRSGARISNLFYTLVAAKRVGGDLAVVQADASVSIVGDGTDTDILQLVSMLNVASIADKGSQAGFCVDNIAFLYPEPKLQARFTLLASDALPGQSVNNNNKLSITFDNSPSPDGTDNRPSPPTEDPIAGLQGLDLSSDAFQVGAFDAELRTISGSDGPTPLIIQNAFVAGQARPGRLPFIFATLERRGDNRIDAGEDLLKRLLNTVHPN